MNVVIVKDYHELSVQAAQLVADQITRKKNTVLGLATGQTPVGMYQELIKKFKKGEIDFSQVVTFNLDEYYGLSPEHPQSYHYFMWDTFFQHININKENIYLLNGITDNIDEECQRFEDLIKKRGGLDLQILGIGDNGHLGFNEPAIGLNSKTHLVNLSKATIRANVKYFDDIKEVPRQALTMGIGTIMKAEKIILLASGRKKSPVIVKTIKGPVSTEVPATVLQLHNEVSIILDQDAASKL
ncbi:MAG: glucosamine-6-phosphate deaminase [Atribacterota bacterium]|jgi:glucosamine-6-phosphate deaminase|nr:glucosamine-6-phosphate deaminase [Atribacterota bacterium]MDD4895587.1 glucosamine-6-phosphate deaminase [Atribacterota bacterium]MDD5636838.1 glucosamine-6-phosphate deaminase [Atribacterota bacterium]